MTPKGGTGAASTAGAHITEEIGARVSPTQGAVLDGCAETAAAGNEALPATLFSLARVWRAISAGATGRRDARAPFSRHATASPTTAAPRTCSAPVPRHLGAPRRRLREVGVLRYVDGVPARHGRRGAVSGRSYRGRSGPARAGGDGARRERQGAPARPRFTEPGPSITALPTARSRTPAPSLPDGAGLVRRRTRE